MRDTGEDLDELAAAISALDLVITVDNTIAHLSGALGRPVWVMLPYSAEWRYGQSGSTVPWYPSMRLFRQTEPRDWSSVVAEILQGLQRGV
jgi:ADP-heptose:LPS heptosyltransferase